MHDGRHAERDPTAARLASQSPPRDDRARSHGHSGGMVGLDYCMSGWAWSRLLRRSFGSVSRAAEGRKRVDARVVAASEWDAADGNPQSRRPGCTITGFAGPGWSIHITGPTGPPA